jgi:hypothetical protein
MTREQLIKYTAKNPYDRFPDGRPKVPDALLEKFQDMSSEEINMSRSGYPSQFVDGLQVLRPDKKLIGRALTLQLMPTRPDIADVDAAEWEAQGNQRRRDHQNAIDLLQRGDVFVVDVFGSVAAGGVIGDNLAYYIMKTTGAGFVIDGAIRDLDGISPLLDLAGYFSPHFSRRHTSVTRMVCENLGTDECVPRRAPPSPNTVSAHRRVDTSVSPLVFAALWKASVSVCEKCGSGAPRHPPSTTLW